LLLADEFMLGDSDDFDNLGVETLTMSAIFRHNLLFPAEISASLPLVLPETCVERQGSA